MTEFLFPGVDLVARNIQRGRDHGLPAYNKFREFCGLRSDVNDRIKLDQILNKVFTFLYTTRPACSWSSPPAEIRPSDWLLLSTLYDRPSDIDFFVGGLAERTTSGDNDEEDDSAVGPTFACIIARQFRALKDGDRFFFTHDGSGGVNNPFTAAQLKALRRRTLRDLICENTGVESMRTSALLLLGEGGEEVECTRTNSLEFELFV